MVNHLQHFFKPLSNSSDNIQIRWCALTTIYRGNFCITQTVTQALYEFFSALSRLRVTLLVLELKLLDPHSRHYHLYQTNQSTTLPFLAILDWIVKGIAQWYLAGTSYLFLWQLQYGPYNYDPRAQHHDQILLDRSQFCGCCRSTFFNLCPTQMHWKTIIIIVVSGPFASMGIWNGFEILQCLPAFFPQIIS